MEPRLELLPVTDLKPHEDVDADRVQDLAERLAADGYMSHPVVADAETRVVIDGHHRLAALRKLGAKRAPVYLLDYQDPAITVDTWRQAEKAPSKAEVVARALSGALFPVKTTRHPSIYGLKPVETPLEALTRV